MLKIIGIHGIEYTNQRKKMLTLNETIKLLKEESHNKALGGSNDTRVEGLWIVSKIYNVSIDFLQKKVYAK